MTAIDFNLDTSGTPKKELIFPGFVSRRPAGVFIDMRALTLATGGFELFVDRLFSAEMRFSGLDYGAFLKLLYDPEWLAVMQGKCAEAKIADQITDFSAERKALYHEVRLLDHDKYAEYFFEPVSFSETYQEAVYGKPDENGAAPIIEYVSKTKQIPAKLDFDEFVADMWLNGVKFGIDANVVREAIAKSTPSRITFARYQEPTAGSDAEILEVCPDLHRDNSPKILLSGKADLKVYKNRFPQIGKGKRLLKKIARVLGKPGHLVTGEIIEPKLPTDIDFYALASTGTAVNQEKDGEFIVSTRDGFLTIDTKSNLISVTEKIETEGGISMKTTGDLMLDVDEFVEHGEVQEGRRVEGKHMTFLSDVFGTVISNHGNIFISGNLSGGRAESMGGNVTLGNNVSRSIVLAHDGVVTVHYCEHSLIVGKEVHIEHAVNCEIIADEVTVELSEGCLVAAEKVKVVSSGERRGKETLVTVLIPDLSEYDLKIATMKKKIAEDQEGSDKRKREIEALKSDPEFAKYLSLHERIRSGAIKLTPEHAVNWRKMIEKHARASNQFAKLSSEMNTLDLGLKELEKEVARISSEREAMGEGICCVIDKVIGQTTGQTMKTNEGVGVFSGKSSHEIRTILHKVDSHKARIFSEDDGAINWKYTKSKSA